MAHVGLVTLVVRDYDEAIDFYVRAAGFELREDTRLSEHERWVVVTPPGAREAGVLLARAVTARQEERVGDQAGGRVGLFLHTAEFYADYERMRAAGVRFAELPRQEPYGIVAVFEDLYGNRWDLIQPRSGTAPGDPRPTLAGRRIVLRPGRADDASRLRAVLAEPSVSQWWGEPEPVAAIVEDLRGDGSSVLLVAEIGGQVAGGIQYHEENTPMYRHAGIDIYLGARFQGRGAGREAVALLARFLFEQRGHHRITIDPAAANEPAIRCYTAVGFRPVGVMRQYERGSDGRFHDGLLMDLLPDELRQPGDDPPAPAPAGEG